MIQLLEERWRAAVRNRMAELSGVYGDLPLKWFVECLEAVRVPLSSEERANKPGPFPYFGASGVIDSIDGYLFDETLVLLGEDGAQLADPTCEISFVVEGKSWVNNHAHVLRPVAADPYFLALHLSTFDRTAFISGSTREKITQGEMNSIPVPALEVEAQRNEAIDLVRVKRTSESAVRRLTHQIDLLAERRQALITGAVTGRLDVAHNVAEEAS
jgi:type I restriction enzyme S subunit